jgi:opacity protein-like surface antigen
MRKHFLGVIAAITFAAAPAIAADLAPYKAAPILPTSWSGFYIGINGGGGMASADALDPDCYTCADTKFQVPFGTFGGQAGYNWQFGAAVLGIEGDINWAGASSTHTYALDDIDSAGTASFKLDAFSTIRGRAGLAYNNALIYITGGAAFGHFNSAVNEIGIRGLNFYSAAAFDNEWHTGVVAGAGLDFMLSPNWVLGAEFLTMMFPDQLVPLVHTTNGSPSCEGGATCRENFAYSTELVRARLSYKW